jgi:hypothetical protein
MLSDTSRLAIIDSFLLMALIDAAERPNSLRQVLADKGAACFCCTFSISEFSRLRWTTGDFDYLLASNDGRHWHRHAAVGFFPLLKDYPA